MSYDEYMLMFYIALVLCIVFFILSVVLFFVLGIPKAVGDVTGWTRKKAIRDINEQNERMKKQKNGASDETDRISASGRIISDYTANTVITEKIETEDLGSGSETTVLNGEGAGETTVLSAGGVGETTVLPAGGIGETTVLDGMGIDGQTAPLQTEEFVPQKGFIREIKDITFIHTTEIIY